MNNIQNKIGFMQGRLSDLVENKIQAFPWGSWKDEFKIANSIDLRLMEWTLDKFNLNQNPLVNKKYDLKIKKLCTENNIEINSLTGDCFMQSPFWKSSGEEKRILIKDLNSILEACLRMSIEIIVIPLVDNGSIESYLQERNLVEVCLKNSKFLEKNKMKIAFESDFSPNKLSKFIDLFPVKTFGINYDIGNSASMGFNPINEFEEYGERIINVHVKDRIKNGSTVPLGEGDAEIDLVFNCLSNFKYQGNFIIQAARCPNNNHSRILDIYREFVYQLIKNNF